MNFIRLWSLPSSLVKDPNNEGGITLLNNILELLMCRAFECLPSQVLEDLFAIKCLNTGLNVLPPLFQSQYCPMATRRIYTSMYKTSSDALIQKWPDIRAKQLQMTESAGRKSRTSGKPKVFEPVWTPRDYHSSLFQVVKTALNMDAVEISLPLKTEGFTQHIMSIDDTFQWVSGTLGKNNTLCKPFGTFSASLGVILDRCPIIKSENEERIARNICALPQRLIDAGFSEENSLIWSFYFHQCFKTSMISTRQSIPQNEHDVLLTCHRKMIENSNTSIILVCGKRVTSVVLTLGIEKTTTPLHLRGCSCDYYVEHRSGFFRLYIDIGSLAFSTMTGNWDRTKRCAEILNFLRFVIEVKELRPYAFFSHETARYIVKRFADETSGTCDQTNTIDKRVQEWLAIKGITSESQFQKWIDLAGSVTKALLLFLITIPRRPPSEVQVVSFLMSPAPVFDVRVAFSQNSS
jgi:hypothetical protein